MVWNCDRYFNSFRYKNMYRFDMENLKYFSIYRLNFNLREDRLQRGARGETIILYISDLLFLYG